MGALLADDDEKRGEVVGVDGIFGLDQIGQVAHHQITTARGNNKKTDDQISSLREPVHAWARRQRTYVAFFFSAAMAWVTDWKEADLVLSSSSILVMVCMRAHARFHQFTRTRSRACTQPVTRRDALQKR